MASSTVARPGGRARPVADAAMPPRVASLLRTVWSEAGLIMALMVMGLMTHGTNMLRYPAFTSQGDEGIYTAQAWSVLQEGRLAPYTYFYDHAPAGWIMVAGWMGLTGGPYTFGNASDSGRVLMLLLHLIMIPLLYRVARKLGCGVAAAALGTMLFSLSPLALYYQRIVLLDTIMLFWVLLSLDLLLDGWGRLSRVAISGLCFGVALLSKETAVFLLPAMLFIAWQQRWQHQGRYALIGWLAPMLLVVSWYPLYAVLKGELLPAALAARFSLFGIDPGPRVSLIDSLLWQSSRSGGSIFDLDSRFWAELRADWLPRDPVLLVGGAVATALNLLRGVRDRHSLAAGLLGVLPLYYLARGGIVFNFYILFAIPFLCLNLGVLLAPAFARLPAPVVGALALTTALVLGGGYWQAGTLQPLYREQPDQAGREAVAWIKASLPEHSFIIMGDAFWTDLHEPGFVGPAFPNAHSHFKVAADPAIRDDTFKNDWRMVDYLIMSEGMERNFVDMGNTVALEAKRNAHLVKTWTSDDGTPNSRNRQTIELWKVDKPGATERMLLDGSTARLVGHFERAGTYPAADGTVTSEAQAYALLRAVWSGDRAGFDRTWAWTRANLLTPEGLLAWQWRDGAVTDRHSAADADTDTALALLMAGKRWDDPALLESGRRMVATIWAREVVIVRGTPYLTAGDWATTQATAALNPGYLAPYAYRVFAEADPENDWRALIDSSYRVLVDVSAASLGGDRSVGLPPDWVGLDRTTGELVPLPLPDRETTAYGFNAARTYWRVALDGRWSGDGRAGAYLRQAGFLRDEVNRKGYVGAAYAHDGATREGAPSLVGTAGALAALLTLDPAAANALYARAIVGAVDRDAEGVSWGARDDLYAQEWGWFTVALYADALPDLWHAPPAR